MIFKINLTIFYFAFLKRAEIRSIFNLQSRGEHKDCGLGLHKESGFSYNPIDFTAAGSKLKWIWIFVMIK